MFFIVACTIHTWTMLATSAARLTLPSQEDLATACDSEHETKVTGELLKAAGHLRYALEQEPVSLDGPDAYEQWKSEQARVLESTPFAACGPAGRDLPLEKIANEDEPVALCGIGKLAKGGSFFASVDGSVLAKRVDKNEAQELARWGKHAIAKMPDYPGGCEGFRSTLLVETALSFGIDGSTYIVMPNLTRSLELASPGNWGVVAVYDAKPLPNLGKGLVRLFKDVTTGWGVDLPRLSEWLGWEQVQSSILRDMEFLASRVVDFSLFVHVLRRETDDDRIPAMLGPVKGCIVEPSRSLLICFRVLDYLTPFSWVRRMESQMKIEKFHDYAGKFYKAFDCLSKVDQLECANYKALANITEAMEVSKNMAKAVFIGSTAFREAYTCIHFTPSLQYIAYHNILSRPMAGQPGIVWGNEMDVPGNKTEVAKSVKWIIDRSKSAKWLQALASPEVAYSVGEKFKAHMQVAYTQNEARGNSTSRMPKHYFQSCFDTVKAFATESYVKGFSKKDMFNVLWDDGSENVIVVRGQPQTFYEHRDTVENGRLNNCFLKTHYMRCHPEEQGGYYFNYKQHFGVLEVLVMAAREYSDDMDVYLKALQTRKEIPDSRTV